eukprot:scaffold265131_cov32-Tisochrysis_lutea.AAC.4
MRDSGRTGEEVMAMKRGVRKMCGIGMRWWPKSRCCGRPHFCQPHTFGANWPPWVGCNFWGGERVRGFEPEKFAKPPPDRRSGDPELPLVSAWTDAQPLLLGWRETPKPSYRNAWKSFRLEVVGRYIHAAGHRCFGINWCEGMSTPTALHWHTMDTTQGLARLRAWS